MSSITCPRLVPALACIAGLVLAWPGAAEAEKKHPAEEAGARALESKVATSLRFVNDSFETLKIFRLDEQGQRVLMKTLEPGDTYDIAETYLTHPWLIADQNGDARSLYYPDSQPRTVEIPGGMAYWRSLFRRYDANGDDKLDPQESRLPAWNWEDGDEDKDGLLSVLEYRKTRAVRTLISGSVRCLQAADVQKELKLTADQITRIQALTATPSVPSTTPPFGSSAGSRGSVGDWWSNTASDMIPPELKELAKERMEKLLAALLDPSQRKRLEQIERQMQFDSLARGGTDRTGDLLPALQLTKEQEAIREAYPDEFRRRLSEIALSTDRESRAKQFAELHETLRNKFKDSLSPQQKKVMDELMGPPFLGNVATSPLPASGSAPFRVAPATGAEGGAIDPRYLEYFKKMIIKYDRNNDGALTADEWSSMSRNPEAADTDGDKRITLEEYTRWEMRRLRPTTAPLPQAPPADKPAKPVPVTEAETSGQTQLPAPADKPAKPAPVTEEFGKLELLNTYMDLLSQAGIQELKLTETQIKTLELRCSAPDAGETISDAALSEILTPEQLRRQREVQLQRAQRRLGPTYLFRYRVVVEALGLTDKQREQAQAAFQAVLKSASIGVGLPRGISKEERDRNQATLEALLSADQKTRWRELLGEPSAAPVTTLPVRPGASEFGTEEWYISRAERQREPVAQELKFSPTQRAALGSLDVLAGESTLAEILTPRQVARCRQIALQLAISANGPMSLFQYRSVVERLNLTPDQVDKLKLAYQEFNAVKGRRYRGSAVQAEQDQATIDAILTAEQKQRWQDLLGPGRTVQDFGQAELSHVALFHPSAANELALTESQLNAVRERQLKWLLDFETPDGSDLLAILTPEQLRTYQRLALQIASRAQGPICLLRYRLVVEGLGLTEDQAAQLKSAYEGFMSPSWSLRPVNAGTKANSQAAIDTILTAEQQGRWKALLGEPLVVARPDSFGRMSANDFGTEEFVHSYGDLRSELVVQELQLTPEQLAALETHRRETTDKSGLRRETIDESAVAEILTAEQLHRYRQIEVQMANKSLGPIGLLQYRRVVERLGLTAEQTAQLGTVYER